jgi:D-3-phosphoglycerate dehydrogenase / 2-oxoglutarate reductase
MTNSSTVFITETLVYPEAAAILQAAGRVLWGLPEDQRMRPASGQHYADQVALIRTVLAGALPEVDAFYGYFPYDAALIEAATRLQVIITPSSGAEHVDLGAATAHGVAVVNAAGAAYGPVAEHVIGLALSLLKYIAIPDRVAHSRSSALSSGQILNRPRLPSMLGGKTIGIVGLGFIGREIARIASYGFRMTVLAYDPYFDPAEARRQGVSLVPRLADLLGESDVVTVNCPLTPETRGIIGAPQLAQMKPSAILINCSRGGTVVTDDLVAALTAGTIAGVGLDVTDPEPLPAGHPLFALENVVLTPHIAGAAIEAMVSQGVQSARDGVQVLSGGRPFHLVNPEVWPHRKALR